MGSATQATEAGLPTSTRPLKVAVLLDGFTAKEIPPIKLLLTAANRQQRIFEFEFLPDFVDQSVGGLTGVKTAERNKVEKAMCKMRSRLNRDITTYSKPYGLSAYSLDYVVLVSLARFSDGWY